jgi:hypothetical protein
MTTGFSLVLYSRLHILVQDKRILRSVLIMIIFDGVSLHTATTIIQLVLPTLSGEAAAPWSKAAEIAERLHTVWFTLQEIVISCLYMKAARDQLQDRMLPSERTKKVMIWLITVQLVGVTLDIILVVFDLSGYFVVKLITHSFVYSVKLELEFFILNQLVALSHLQSGGLRSIPPDQDTPVSNQDAIVRSPQPMFSPAKSACQHCSGTDKF